MKRLTIFIACCVFAHGCATERYLPEQVNPEITFGMPLKDFLKHKGDKVSISDDGMDFRIVYFEEAIDEKIAFYGYYFDADNDQPLYEVIIGYKSEGLRDSEAKRLLGEPNHEKAEWRINPKKGYDLMAWTFEKKLIITSLIPETEWYEDQQAE